MAYYNQCSKCGSNLDPCEVCECESKVIAVKSYIKKFNQMKLKTKKSATVRAVTENIGV